MQIDENSFKQVNECNIWQRLILVIGIWQSSECRNRDGISYKQEKIEKRKNCLCEWMKKTKYNKRL